MRILIIANPLVGIQKDKKTVIDEITSHIIRGGNTADITYIMKPGMGQMRSARASLEGYDSVYAAGGDGTMNEVATGLVGRSIPLGIIPLGTGNGFARGLGIPLDIKDIIAVLLKNKVTTIDSGKFASRFFFATAGIGFDASIAYEFSQKRKNGKNLKDYVIAAVKNYFTKKSEQITLVVDGQEITRTVFGLTVCNTPQYGGGATIAPQADPKSGKLIAALIPKLNVFKAIPAIQRLFDGTLTECKDLEYITFKTLKIMRQTAGLCHVDGETFTADSILNVSVLPSSLKVIVP